MQQYIIIVLKWVQSLFIECTSVYEACKSGVGVYKQFMSTREMVHYPGVSLSE